MAGSQAVSDASAPPIGIAARVEAQEAEHREPTGPAAYVPVTIAPTQQPGHAVRLAAVIVLLGLILTGLSAWAAARVDQNTEQRLLEVQTKQAGTVLSSAIMLIEAPLTTALSVESLAGSNETGAFERFMSASVGSEANKLFSSASVWRRQGDQLIQVDTVGAAPVLAPTAPETQAYLRRAFDHPTFTVRALSVGSRRLIAYALADKASNLVVYAERPLPANRRAPVDKDSAYADLHYAIYLGKHTDLASLSTTDVNPAMLPLTGTTARTTIPFGDTVLVLVASPRHHLGATLSERLPLALLLGGLLLSLIAARTGHQLVRRRQLAEAHTSTITALYDRVETLYGQQRELSEKLQRALLPHAIPDVPQLEVAAEYVAGALGVEIGGDWYSLIGAGDDRFVFVVGDVSGRGIDAVAVMAHARFTLRAYLIQGDTPVEALEKCSHQFDIDADGHMTTTVVGVGNWRTGEITVASAGHPPPLLLRGETAEFIDVTPGPPLGAGPSSYTSTSFRMSPGSTLVCFTDGLIERRSESIDVGMDRLARTVEGSAGQPVDLVVSDALARLRSDDAPDDIAVLAIRWVPA